MSEGSSEAPVAVVSGATGGIGSEICRALAGDGFRVAGLDVNRESDSFEVFECDVTSDESIRETFEQIERRYGRIDAVIHCAGISCDGVVWKLAVEDWDRVLSVNLRGAFLLIRHAIPVMRRAGNGQIVLIGSINGSRGKFGTSAYSASKAGLIGLAKSVSREAGRFGIRVNVVEPGWVVTPLTESAPDDVKEKAKAETLLGELVETKDVAEAVRFLCGAGGRRVTGQILRVDSGQYLGPI